MLPDLLSRCQILVPAAHWLAGGNAAEILSAMKTPPGERPRVGLFGWMADEVADVWASTDPPPKPPYLVSAAAGRYLQTRWPGVEFILLPDDAPEEWGRRVTARAQAMLGRIREQLARVVASERAATTA